MLRSTGDCGGLGYGGKGGGFPLDMGLKIKNSFLCGSGPQGLSSGGGGYVN